METILDLAFQLYRAAQDSPLGDFDDMALSLLKALVPFCAAIWFAAELVRGRLNLYRAHPYELTPDALSLVASPSPKLSRAFAAAAETPRCAYSCYTRALYRDDADRDALQLIGRLRLERQLLIADVETPAAVGSWLSLYRSKEHAQFDERELHAVGLIMPHLSQALALNRALHLEKGAAAESFAAGDRALVQADGKLLHCGARLGEMIRAECPSWDGVTLPEKILKEVVRGRVVHFSGNEQCMHVSRLAGALLLTVRRVTLAERLSPQELAVAQLFGGGASYKEIARRVALAPATVRNVVQNAYRKLGINNKAQLARLVVGSG